MEKVIPTLADLDTEAKLLLDRLAPRQDTATLITLSGELGAGKTAFTKAIADKLGVAEMVNSPTFVLEKIYAPEMKEKFERLVHIDAYRLESGKDLSALGFEESMRDPKNLILLEWPERVRDALPTPSVSLSITLLPDGSRKFLYA